MWVRHFQATLAGWPTWMPGGFTRPVCDRTRGRIRRCHCRRRRVDHGARAARHRNTSGGCAGNQQISISCGTTLATVRYARHGLFAGGNGGAASPPPSRVPWRDLRRCSICTRISAGDSHSWCSSRCIYDQADLGREVRPPRMSGRPFSWSLDSGWASTTGSSVRARVRSG